MRRIQKETLFSKNYLSDIVSDCDVLRAETDKLSPNVQDLSKEVDRVSIVRDQVLFEREAVSTYHDVVNEVYTEIFKEKELQMEESIDTQDLIKKLKEKSICMSVEKATAGLEIKNLKKERNLILEQKVATINQCNNLKEKITRLVREKICLTMILRKWWCKMRNSKN